jgi:hypothetical protein
VSGMLRCRKGGRHMAGMLRFRKGGRHMAVASGFSRTYALARMLAAIIIRCASDVP